MDLQTQATTAMALAGLYAAELRTALVTAAVQVANEGADTPNHDARVSLAHRVLRDPSSMSDAFAYAIATNATVVDEFNVEEPSAAFGDVPYVITTVWDALALSFASST